MSNITKSDIDKFTKAELKDMLDKKEKEEKERQARLKQKKFNQKMSDWLVPFIVFANIAFSIIMTLLFFKTGSEPSTLIDRWFQFTGVELIAMAGIKITNVIGENFGRNE